LLVYMLMIDNFLTEHNINDIIKRHPYFIISDIRLVVTVCRQKYQLIRIIFVKIEM
jgi:hypothetical protein